MSDKIYEYTLEKCQIQNLIILVLPPNKLTEIIQLFFNLHIFKIRVVSLEHCQVQTTSSVMLNAFTSSVEAADFNLLVGVQQKPL